MHRPRVLTNLSPIPRTFFYTDCLLDLIEPRPTRVVGLTNKLTAINDLLRHHRSVDGYVWTFELDDNHSLELGSPLRWINLGRTNMHGTHSPHLSFLQSLCICWRLQLDPRSASFRWQPALESPWNAEGNFPGTSHNACEAGDPLDMVAWWIVNDMIPTQRPFLEWQPLPAAQVIADINLPATSKYHHLGQICVVAPCQKNYDNTQLVKELSALRRIDYWIECMMTDSHFNVV